MVADREAAIKKVKLLLALAKSPNEHEASNARESAVALIAQFDLLNDEYNKAEAKSYDTDDALLFEELILTEWRGIIAIACANKLDCVIIREDATSQINSDVVMTYRYFVYGDDADVVNVKTLFNLVVPKIEELITTKCAGKGELYCSSFAEGAANAVKDNIAWEVFETTGVVKTLVAEEPEAPKDGLVKTTTALAKVDEIVKEKTMINGQDKPIDIVAYVRGQHAGSKVHIGKTIEEDLPVDSELTIAPSLWGKVKGYFAGDDGTDDDYDW